MSKTELKMGPGAAENCKHFATRLWSHPPSPSCFAFLDMVRSKFPECRRWVLFTCQVVTPSLSGPDSSMKISANFIRCYLVKKPNFSPVWHALLSRWLPFEHSGSKMGQSWHWPCVLKIVSQYHIYSFHIKIPLQHVSVQRRRCRHDQNRSLFLGQREWSIARTYRSNLC